MVLDPRAERIVGRCPGQRPRARAQGLHRPGGGRRHGVQGVHHSVGVERRVGVVEDAGRGFELGARRGLGVGLDRVADHPHLGLVGVGEQEAARGVGDLEACVGVDGGQQPGGGAGEDIDAGDDAEDEAALVDEVELAGERAAAAWDVDVDVAEPDVAEAERADVEVGIELLDDPHLGDEAGRVSGVLEGDEVGQRRVGREETLVACAVRPVDAHGLAGRAADAEEPREVGVVNRQRREPLVHADVDQECLVVGRVGEAEVELAGVGDRGGAVGLAVVAVPRAHLLEEGHQVAARDDLLPRLSAEQAGGDDGHEACELGPLADGGRLVPGPQLARVGQRRQVGVAPGHRIGCGHAQALGGVQRSGVRQHRQPQVLGGLQLVGHVLGRRHRRGGGLDVEVECQVLELKLHQALEEVGVLLEQVLQPGVALDREREARVAAVDEVVGEPRGHQVAVEVDDRIEVGPGHVVYVWLAAQVGAEFELLAGDEGALVAEARHAELEVDVGRIDVGEAVDADAVPAHLAEVEGGRPAHADREVERQCLLDQVAVGHAGDLAVGVGDLHVVEAVGRAAEVEGGDDLGGIDHAVVDGLELGKLWPDELDDGRGVELRAGDHGGDVAAVAAGVGPHVGDAEGQHAGRQVHRRVGRGARAADQDVVGALARLGHARRLVGPQVALVGRVVVDRAGQPLVAGVELVGAAVVVAGQRDLEGLARGHVDGVEQLLARRQVVVGGDAEHEGLDADVDGVARGALVVGVVGAFVDVVEEVGADDHAIGLGQCRGQRGGEGGGVLPRRGERGGMLQAALLDAADQPVAQIPYRVGGQVGRVGPVACDRLGAVVRHEPFDGDGVAREARRRHGDAIDLEVGGRRQLDEHRDGRRAGVVALVRALVDLAPRGQAGHVGEHEDVVGAEQAPRDAQRPGHGVARAGCRGGGEGSGVIDPAQVVVAADVEVLVARQVDAVAPRALAVGHVARAQVGDLVGEVEAAPDGGMGRGVHHGDL